MPGRVEALALLNLCVEDASAEPLAEACEESEDRVQPAADSPEEAGARKGRAASRRSPRRDGRPAESGAADYAGSPLCRSAQQHFPSPPTPLPPGERGKKWLPSPLGGEEWVRGGGRGDPCTMAPILDAFRPAES